MAAGALHVRAHRDRCLAARRDDLRPRRAAARPGHRLAAVLLAVPSRSGPRRLGRRHDRRQGAQLVHVPRSRRPRRRPGARLARSAAGRPAGRTSGRSSVGLVLAGRRPAGRRRPPVDVCSGTPGRCCSSRWAWPSWCAPCCPPARRAGLRRAPDRAPRRLRRRPAPARGRGLVRLVPPGRPSSWGHDHTQRSNRDPSGRRARPRACSCASCATAAGTAAASARSTRAAASRCGPLDEVLADVDAMKAAADALGEAAR